MPFETLDQYSSDAATDLGGSRGLIGKVMKFGGFIILGNTLVIALLFRHLISFRTQLICTVGGGIIGVFRDAGTRKQAIADKDRRRSLRCRDRRSPLCLIA